MNTTFRSILVPLDGSPFGEQALPLACEITRRSEARLRLVHIHALSASPIYIEGHPVIDDKLASLGREHERIYLEQTRERVAGTVGAGLNIEVEFVDRSIESLMNDPLGSFLANHAAATQTDLIVMTTHGRGGMGRFWLGSVADTLVRLSKVPILLVRPQTGAAEFAAPSLFKRILIPLDGSELAEQILEPAYAIGDLTQAAYSFLRVVEPPASSAPATHQVAPQVVEAQAYLDRLAQHWAAKGQQIQTRVMLAAQPALAILEAAQQEESDLIAVATHGRSGLRRLLIGSVADKVLRGAVTPLLVYRPQLEEVEG